MATYSSTSCDGSHRCLQQLPSALQLHILSLLSPNDRALSGRLVSPDAAAGLNGPEHCTACLSQPLPPDAVPWAVEAGQQHVRQLPCRHKLQLLCLAAASGSEVTLEVALALLQPCIFSKMLHDWRSYSGPDPGVSAVKAGHPQLLGWLLRHCPGLLHGKNVLKAAAKHCDLAGLQLAWAVLKSGAADVTGQQLLDSAVGSTTSPDTIAKVVWLLQQTGQLSCDLKSSTAVAAARSGDLGRLRWLRERGCPMDLSVLRSALEHADLAVAHWLVDEGGCSLPEPGVDDAAWADLASYAARSPQGLDKSCGCSRRGRQVHTKAHGLAWRSSAWRQGTWGWGGTCWT